MGGLHRHMGKALCFQLCHGLSHAVDLQIVPGQQLAHDDGACKCPADLPAGVGLGNGLFGCQNGFFQGVVIGGPEGYNQDRFFHCFLPFPGAAGTKRAAHTGCPITQLRIQRPSTAALFRYNASRSPGSRSWLGTPSRVAPMAISAALPVTVTGSLRTFTGFSIILGGGLAFSPFAAGKGAPFNRIPYFYSCVNMGRLSGPSSPGGRRAAPSGLLPEGPGPAERFPPPRRQRCGRGSAESPADRCPGSCPDRGTR